MTIRINAGFQGIHDAVQLHGNGIQEEVGKWPTAPQRKTEEEKTSRQEVGGCQENWGRGTKEEKVSTWSGGQRRIVHTGKKLEQASKSGGQVCEWPMEKEPAGEGAQQMCKRGKGNQSQTYWGRSRSFRVPLLLPYLK